MVSFGDTCTDKRRPSMIKIGPAAENSLNPSLGQDCWQQQEKEQAEEVRAWELLLCSALPCPMQLYPASVLLFALYSWHRLRLCSVGTRRSLVPFASPPPHLQLTLLAYHHKFEKSHLPIALALLNLKIWHGGMILLEVQIDSSRS